MMYSFRIEQAIRAATILHEGQTRRGPTPYPYITHLFSVACILADYTRDEDIVIAGLLHDTLEDTDYTADELESDFGTRVRSIVEGVTEKKFLHNDRAAHLSWKERKDAFIASLEQVPEDCLLVLAGDKLHNMRAIVEDYSPEPSKYRIEFGGTIAERLTFHQAISDVLHARLHNPIIHEFDHVFAEYKNFLDDVPEN